MNNCSLFRDLHNGPGAFIMPNPWDIGSAKILAASGFKALATTSAGMAFNLGFRDGNVPKELVFEHCKSIVEATPLPVSADLENGFGHSPEEVANTIMKAIDIGLAGASIEDHTGSPEKPMYDFALAVERIAAAVEAARASKSGFVVTARCESMFWEQPNLDKIILRLQAFERAGADVLFAPGLTDIASIQKICGSVKRPVNVLMESTGKLTVAEFAAAGAKRISTGVRLACLAYGSLVTAAREMAQTGSFDFAENAANFETISDYFPKKA